MVQHGVTFDKEEFSWIECFANVIRPKMPSTTNKVFLSWTGMDITSGYVSGRLHNLWKAGIYKDKKLAKKLSGNCKVYVKKKKTSKGSV